MKAALRTAVAVGLALLGGAGCGGSGRTELVPDPGEQYRDDPLWYSSPVLVGGGTGTGGASAERAKLERERSRLAAERRRLEAERVRLEAERAKGVKAPPTLDTAPRVRGRPADSPRPATSRPR